MTKAPTQEEQATREQMERSLNLILKPDAVVELRVLGVGQKGATWAGYFEPSHRNALIDAAIKYNGRADGIFITLNPLHRGVIARQGANTLHEIYGRPAGGGLSKDTDVLCRIWLPVDFDAVRPSGISSTDHEKALAEAVMRRCYAYFVKKKSWPAPIVADSGNGYHLMWMLELPNDEASKQQVKSLLEMIKGKFETREVRIDAEVFNSSRIWKLYGSIAAKGEDYISETDPTQSRPHRMSKLLHVPEEIKPCPQ